MADTIAVKRTVPSPPVFEAVNEDNAGPFVNEPGTVSIYNSKSIT